MVRLERLFLIITLCVVGSTLAADQTIPATNTSLTEQVIARDIQDIKELIRDTSWPIVLTYNPNAYYDLYESQLFKDKITIRETTLNNKLDYIFGLFCVEIPREWQISIDKVATYHLDPLDALSIGAKSANSAIVKASLNLLPYTKSALTSGKTTDFMDHIFTVNGKFKVDQFVEAACDGLVCKINRLRILKFGGLLFTTAVLAPKEMYGYENPIETIIKGCCESIAHKLPIEASKAVASKTISSVGLFGIFTRQTAVKTGPKSLLTGSIVRYGTAAASTIAAALWHKLEQIYIDGYITSLELLINSEKTCYEKELTKKRLTKLHTKLSWFGLSRNATSRLQTLINKS